MKKILLFLSFLLMSIGVWSAEYTTGTIPNGWTASGGSMTMNSISWVYSSATYLGNTAGKIQVGSAKKPQTTNWTISTPISNFGTITNISITAYTTATSATYDISANGSSLKSGNLTTSSNTYSIGNLNVNDGDIVVTLKGSSASKAMYLCNISITYSDTPITPCDSVTATLFTSHGSATLSKTKICPNESIEITNITPNEGYELDTIIVTNCIITGNVLSSFTGNATVEVLFKEILVPNIDIVEWNTNYIKVDIDNFDEAVTAFIENKNTQLNVENFADSIFFSKYFEAASNVKLLGIFNGTDHTVNLSEYQIWTDNADATGWASKKSINELFKSYSFDSIKAILDPGKELILIGYQISDSATIRCIKDDPRSNYSTYIRLGQWLDFNGDDAVALVNPEGELIDLIGAGTKSDGRCLTGGDVVTTNSNNGDVNGFMDKPGGWYTEKGYKSNDDHTEESNYKLSSNRCLLIRRKHVKSGLDAVQRNTTKFLTLGDYTYNDNDYKGEWKGVQIPGKTSEGGADATCNGFVQVGSYDYNAYYATYTQVGDTIRLDTVYQKDGSYQLSIPHLDTLSCTYLKVIVSDGTKNEEEEYKIPIFVTNSVNSDNIIFTQERDDCPECDVVVLDGGTLTINQDLTNRNATVYPGGRLIVPEGKTYTLKSLTLRRDNNDLPHLLYNGTLDIENNFTFELRTDGQDWRWMTLPFAFNPKNIKQLNGKPITDILNHKVWISYYDGKFRAENRYNGWKDVASDGVADTTFSAGEGFLFGISGDKVKKIYRFNWSSDSLEHEQHNKVISNLHAWGGNRTDITENNKGWNLIGNPFMDNDTTDIISPVRIGKLKGDSANGQWTGKWVIDTVQRKGVYLRYAVLPVFDERRWTDPDIVAAGGYESVVLDDYILKPFTSFFVQLGGINENPQTLTFEKISEVIPNKIVARQQTIDEDKELFLRVKVGDRKTGCFISNNFTDAYEPGDDLESRYQIYQLINGYKLLYSAINDSIIEHGVRVFTPFGNLHLDSKTNINDFSEIYVLYNNNLIDLLHGENVDVEGEFILYARRKKDINIPTDIDIIRDNMIVKFIQNNNLYIRKNNHTYNIFGGLIK